MIERSVNFVLDNPLIQTLVPDLTAGDWLVGMFFIALVALMWAEKKHPQTPSPKKAARQSYITNLETFFVNDVTMSTIQIPALYVIASDYSDSGLLSSLDESPAKVLIAFVLLDLVMYGWHALSHHCDWLWIFHRVHHSDRTLNVTTGLRYHPGELVMEGLVRAAFIVIVGVGPETLMICQGVMTLFILFHHSNIKVPGERWLAKLFIVPGIHRLHHSALRAEHDSNYGAVLVLWDRLFGTLSLKEPAVIGLNGVEEDDFVSILKDVLPVHRLLQPALPPLRQMVPLRIPVRRREHLRQNQH